MKFASANFYLNLSLKAKDFTRTKCGFHLATARFHISSQTKYFTAMLSTLKLTALPLAGGVGEGSQHNAKYFSRDVIKGEI